jgi:hypothetical protein
MKYTILFTVIFIFNINRAAFAEEIWEQVTGLNETNLRDVAIDLLDKGAIYTAGQDKVYKSKDGRTWKDVYSVSGENNTINSICISEHGIFICTKDDLFISTDNGITWQKDNTQMETSDIRWIEFMGKAKFLATEKGVYKNSGSGWKRIFVTGVKDKEPEPDITDIAEEAIKPVNSIYVHIDTLLLATDSGIFESRDNGETWERFNHEGLMSLHVRRLLFHDGLYAATDKGIFIYSEINKLWQPLYKGMNTKDIKGIAVDNEGNLWAATKKGLYKAKRSKLSLRLENDFFEDRKQDILDSFGDEPSIGYVQKAAIEYAEVHPDKIKAWRDAARKKAMLPNVSVGLDRYVTDYWHWDSGTNPDTLQKGKDAVSWDVTMTWDMSELIWNSNQTSIDTRSKLMVELRDDIMDEVTRTYFERRRLQIEMLTSPPQDLKQSLEKELRLQELTADIDALTGGLFSKQLTK